LEWILDNADSNNDNNFDAYTNGDSYADVNSDGNIDLDCNDNNTNHRDNNTFFLIDTESNNSSMVLLVVSIMPRFSIKDTPCLTLMISVIGRFILIAIVIQMLLIALGSASVILNGALLILILIHFN
jgi:hypothetical protein